MKKVILPVIVLVGVCALFAVLRTNSQPSEKEDQKSTTLPGDDMMSNERKLQLERMTASIHKSITSLEKKIADILSDSSLTPDERKTRHELASKQLLSLSSHLKRLQEDPNDFLNQVLPKMDPESNKQRIKALSYYLKSQPAPYIEKMIDQSIKRLDLMNKLSLSKTGSELNKLKLQIEQEKNLMDTLKEIIEQKTGNKSSK